MFRTETLPTVSTIPATSASEPCSAQRAAWRTEPVPDRGAFLFVALIWAVMTAIGIVYVVRFGPTVLRWDDYSLVSRIAGIEPVTLSWLWSQNNEHRIPLVRLILLGFLRSSEADPRLALVFSVGLLSGTAAVLLIVLRKARGSSSYSDAFVPIMLLNLGHHEIFLWAICLIYVLPLTLLSLLLALVVRCDRAPSLSTSALAAFLVTLLPLCGGGGLLFATAMVFWLWHVALHFWKSKQPGSRARVVFVVACSTPVLCLFWLYFRGYVAPEMGQLRDPWATLRTATQCVVMSLGQPGMILWPFSVIAALSYLAGGVVTLAKAWIAEPAERTRIAGLACVLGAVFLMELALGWSRSGQGSEAGFQNRFTLAALPALLAAYLAFSLYGSSTTRQLIPMMVFCGSSVLLWPNTQEGWETGRQVRALSAAFDRDLSSGTPLYRMVRRYTPALHPSQEIFHEALEQLHQAGIGKYRLLRVDGRFQEQAVPLGPQPQSGQGGRPGEFQVDIKNSNSWCIFDLPAPSQVCGIRMRFTLESPDGAPARFRLAWQRPGQETYPADQQYSNWNFFGGKDQITTIWIDDIVTRIRIQPDNRPCRFKVSELTLLLWPQAGRARP